MRKIVAGFASSLDGYIEGPNGEYDWILIDKEINFAEQMKRYDAFFYGRKTYEAVVKMGNSNPGTATHYVFSNSLDSVGDGFRLIKGDIKKDVIKIKQMEGKDIAVFGGANLLASLLNLKLVDEISVAVIPVILGAGKPMVNVLDKVVKLKLTKTHSYSNGTVQLTYYVNTGR